MDIPENVTRLENVSPGDHPAFYNASRFTLNVTRAEMIRAGYSPSVRLFEAAACGAPILSDDWDGLDMVFTPPYEIVVVRNSDDVLDLLRTMPEDERRAIGARARRRVLAAHTAHRRALELEAYIEDASGSGARSRSWALMASPLEQERSRDEA